MRRSLIKFNRIIMITFVLIAIAAILVTIGLVWLIDKFVPTKIKPVITIVLWVLIAYLGYSTFMSVYNPILFNQVKEKRYAKVIEKLVDIRDSELAYNEVNGKFTDNYDSLVKFIETGKYAIIERRDSTIVDEELTKLYRGVEMKKDIRIIDTLGFVSVKDSLFKSSDRYKTMMNVPFAKEGTKFKLEAGELGDVGEKISVFEASILKSDILFDQDKDYILQENQVNSVEEIKGNAIRVGSMSEVKTNGNWPKVYDTKK